jgi:hypothetical protein
VAEPELSFAGLLRQLRTGARLTQEELAEAAGLSPRSVNAQSGPGRSRRRAGQPGTGRRRRVREITRLCGYLPLAIGMLARQLRHHPARTGAELAANLVAARDRLSVMRAENLSVAAAFDLSYLELTADQQRLFRRLGLVPGPDIDAFAVAALDDTGLDAARAMLDELYDHHLLSAPAAGRYLLHDLLREYAGTLAAGDDDAESRAAAERLVNYYAHAAAAASQHIATRTTAGGRPAPGRPPGPANRLATSTARRWPSPASWALPARKPRPWPESAGACCPGRPAEAAGHLRQALAIYRRIGSPEGPSVQVTLDALEKHGR